MEEQGNISQEIPNAKTQTPKKSRMFKIQPRGEVRRWDASPAGLIVHVG